MLLFLKIVAYGGAILLAVMGAAVTLNPVQPGTLRRKVWLGAFALGGIITFIAGLWLSEKQDADLETKLTGGDNYVYLHADKAALKDRAHLLRIWVCSTGPMFDVKIHPWPFDKYFPNPEYGSMGTSEDHYLGPGCRWTRFAFPPGKFSAELEARNGLALETLEIATPTEGPFTQTCSLTKNGISLRTPECSN
jgi:hypothetical protein